MKRMQKQQGFTIIELVVVILLLGILTATALPRFMDVTDEAHDAVVEGVMGGLNTGAALFRAQWYAENQIDDAITEFGSLRPYARVGYPLGISAVTSAITSMKDSGDCVEIFQNLLQPAGRPTIDSIGTSGAELAAADITSSSYDFLAYMQNLNSTTKRQCVYAYTGQFTDATVYDIPVLIYDARNGTVALGTPL